MGQATPMDEARPSLPRIIVWVGAALREAREVAALLELIADSRIATPGTPRQRAARLRYETLA